MPYKQSYGSRASLRTVEAPLTWAIWWDMHRRPGTEGRSRAMESSEEDALQRAKRFLRLGFVVYAIHDPDGALFLDEAQIAERFAAGDRPVATTDADRG